MQRWWNLPKLVTNTLVNFDNFFNYKTPPPPPPPLHPPLSAQEKIFSKNAIREECALTDKCICSSLNTINLKLFGNNGGIYRFRRKFKKGSGEIKPLGVYRNMIIGNWKYVCLPFCWSWPKEWDNFQKRKDSRRWEDRFWNSGYRHLCTLVIVHISWYLFWLPLEDKT